MIIDNTLIFAGSRSLRLTKAICSCLGVEPAAGEVITFSEGNTFVRVLENVRGRDVYIVQSTVFPTNDSFMELLFWIDALSRASAASVTAIIPYFSYAKGDKKDEPRVSIRARVCADCIEVAGCDRVVTLTSMHPRSRASSAFPSIISMPCQFSYNASPSSTFPNWWSSRPMPALSRRRAVTPMPWEPHSLLPIKSVPPIMSRCWYRRLSAMSEGRAR